MLGKAPPKSKMPKIIVTHSNEQTSSQRERIIPAAQRESLISQYLATFSGRAILAASMVNPLRERLDYQSVARRIFQVDPLPDGALPIYAKDTDVPGYVLNDLQETVQIPIEAGLPIILGYLWSETSRPTLSEAAEVVRGIGTKGGGGVSPYNPNPNPNPTNPIGNIISNVIGNVVKPQSPDTMTSIYSDDATIELKANQNQLKTLQNTGYVDSIAGKYTFKKNLLDQIKSLIGDNSATPKI